MKVDQIQLNKLSTSKVLFGIKIENNYSTIEINYLDNKYVNILSKITGFDCCSI